MVAVDNGTPTLDSHVDVDLIVVDRNNKPPIWEQSTYGPIYVKENTPVGTVVSSVRARFVPQRMSERPALKIHL